MKIKVTVVAAIVMSFFASCFKPQALPRGTLQTYILQVVSIRDYKVDTQDGRARVIYADPKSGTPYSVLITDGVSRPIFPEKILAAHTRRVINGFSMERLEYVRPAHFWEGVSSNEPPIQAQYRGQIYSEWPEGSRLHFPGEIE